MDLGNLIQLITGYVAKMKDLVTKVTIVVLSTKFTIDQETNTTGTKSQ
jgi:hypothetical protein